MMAQNLRRSSFLGWPTPASSEPRIACQEFPATNLRRCQDHPAKMAHVLRPSLTLSAPLPRPASCSIGLAVHHSFAEHPPQKAKQPVPNRSIEHKPLSQVLAPLWYRSRAKAVAPASSRLGRFITWRILSGCFYNSWITRSNKLS